MHKALTSLAAVSLLAAPALASDGPTVTAEDPAGIVAALEMAGYEAELVTDSYGDPLINTEFNGWEARILFYGCDSQTHDGCDSLQLLTGFDRAEPWSGAEVAKIASQFRYASVWLDEEGDPFMQWDIVTADGIPTKVFLISIREFSQAISNVSALVYAEERGE